jgi:hypothetical protein
LNPLVATIDVSHLSLTDSGYSLDDRPVWNGDWVELRTTAVDTETGWLRGRFSWNGDPRVRPMILSATCGIAISDIDDVRWDSFAPADD